MDSMTPLDLFKAVSEQTRLQIIILLMTEGSLCVCELETALKEDQPKVSRHLALLRKQGILATERRGKWIYYHINNDLPRWAEEILKITLKNSQAMSVALKMNLQQMSDRPNACCA